MKKGVFKMTADAKVGLLLGLFFIVIIAFLVNGLPNFIHEKDTSTTSVSIVTGLCEAAYGRTPSRNDRIGFSTRADAAG
jgi:hypothetical protein